MKNLNPLVILVLFATAFISCKKEEDPEPLEQKKEKEKHYMPLAVGNSWDYKSSETDDYTISVTGTKTIDGLDYFILDNTLDNTTQYANYIGNKLYSISESPQGENIKLLLLDEDADIGDEWHAGEIQSVQQGVGTTTTTYNCEYVAHHAEYTANDTTYNDVIEVNMTSTFTMELDPDLLAMIPEDSRETYKAMLESSAQNNSIEQRTFYAKGVGFIFQYSDDMPELGVELKDYTVIE